MRHTSQQRNSDKVTYEPALMIDFMSKSTLLMLATHMTMQITPAHEHALTCKRTVLHQHLVQHSLEIKNTTMTGAETSQA